jgi:hypothetical protein
MDSVQFYQPPFMTLLFSKDSTLLYIDYKPLVALRYKGSQVLKSFSKPSLNR